MNGKIYIIKNYINNKVYIGQTQLSLNRRFSEHKKLSKQKHKKQYIHKAMSKYKCENFYINLLQTNIPTIKELNEWEKFYIKSFNSVEKGYNLSFGGEGSLRRLKIYKYQDIKNIKQLYINGTSIKNISSQYKVSTNTIRKILKKYGVTLKKRSHRNDGKPVIPIETLVKLYEEHKNYRKVSRILDMALSNIIRRLNNHYNK